MTSPFGGVAATRAERQDVGLTFQEVPGAQVHVDAGVEA